MFRLNFESQSLEHVCRTTCCNRWRFKSKKTVLQRQEVVNGCISSLDVSGRLIFIAYGCSERNYAIEWSVTLFSLIMQARMTLIALMTVWLLQLNWLFLKMVRFLTRGYYCMFIAKLTPLLMLQAIVASRISFLCLSCDSQRLKGKAALWSWWLKHSWFVG